MNVLVMLCGWGGAAALAMVALGVTIQTDVGRERLRQAYAGLGAPPAAALARTPEKSPEITALEGRVRVLSADRDKLAARMANLERQLEDVTGSIQRQADEARAPGAAQAAPEPSPAMAIVAAAPSSSAPHEPVKPLQPIKTIEPINPLAMAAIYGAGTGWPVVSTPQAAPAKPAASEPVTPLPPTRLVSAPVEPPPLPKAEFGIELASAGSIDDLREHWTALKANHGPLLMGLQPLAVRERRSGGTEYKLMAGPFAHLNAAQQRCARLTEAHVACRPAKVNADNVVQR